VLSIWEEQSEQEQETVFLRTNNEASVIGPECGGIGTMWVGFIVKESCMNLTVEVKIVCSL
jgi:hypothetical protein